MPCRAAVNGKSGALRQRSEEPAPVRHGCARPHQHDLARFVGKAERQHFGHHRPDLPRREIDHRGDLHSRQILETIMLRDLRRRALAPDRRPEIDHQFICRLARLRKRQCLDDRADADVDGEELVEADRLGGEGGGIVIDGAWPAPYRADSASAKAASTNAGRASSPSCSIVHCRGALSGRQRRKPVPWRKRRPVTWS